MSIFEEVRIVCQSLQAPHPYHPLQKNKKANPQLSIKMWRLKVQPSCTVAELTAIITAPCGGYYEVPTDPYNEVFPNIYIGDAATAMCTQKLRRMGISHVVNVAQGIDRNYGFVNTSHSSYQHVSIRFMGIPAIDLMSFQLEPYFEDAAEFIDEGLRNGGKVLVHCRQGVSRSATIVLAYLMIKKNMTAQEAVRVVRAQREIIPNDGFLRQLCNLNERLERLRRLTVPTLFSASAPGLGIVS